MSLLRYELLVSISLVQVRLSYFGLGCFKVGWIRLGTTKEIILEKTLNIQRPHNTLELTFIHHQLRFFFLCTRISTTYFHFLYSYNIPFNFIAFSISIIANVRHYLVMTSNHMISGILVYYIHIKIFVF